MGACMFKSETCCETKGGKGTTGERKDRITTCLCRDHDLPSDVETLTFLNSVHIPLVTQTLLANKPCRSAVQTQ